MSSSGANSSHKDLLLNAKKQQRHDLQESAGLSEQIAKNMAAIVKMNSTSNVPGCPPVLDKMDTIHELDREIDRQLDKDIAVNYEKLLKAEEKTTRSMNKVNRALQNGDDGKKNRVDLLQQEVELMDQELRILERTLEILRSRKPR